MENLMIYVRDVALFVKYRYSAVFDEVVIEKVELQDSDEDVYELLGESDKEEILIKCMENYEENN